eukprot:14317910-Alexandrium_andersonii.AAC.1
MPQYNPQSARGLSVLQSASIRNLPCVKCTIASNDPTWNCAGPRTASTSVPEAPEGCILLRCPRRFQI